MYSIYVLILVSTFGSSIYCQSCFFTTTACAISSMCCVRLSIPKSIPRTGGLIRIIPNFPVDTDIKNRPGDFILRFQSTIYEPSTTLKLNFTNNFVCNNISIFISTWTCDIKKQDSKLNAKEQIEIVYLIDNAKCCRSRLNMSIFSEIYARDPGITYAPDYTFPGQKGIIKVQFTYCPNEYFTDYTKFTLNNKNLGHEIDKKHVFFGSLCTFLLQMSGDSAGASFMTVIIKINNRPLATNMTIYIRETPSFEATDWITFQQRPLNLPLRGKNFDSLYQPHYQLFTSKGVKFDVTAFESFLTPCRVVNSTLMQCVPLIIKGNVFHQKFSIVMYSHEKKVNAAYNLNIQFMPAPVILFARFNMETDKILEIFYGYIVPSYSTPVVHIVLIKQNVTLLKRKCVDVFLQYASNKMTCLLNETVNKKFQWWVEMTVDNYTLDRYCLVACDTNLVDSSDSLLTFILIAILIVLINLPLVYIYLKRKAKRQPVKRYKSKLHGNTLAHPKSLLASFLREKSHDNIVKSYSSSTRSKKSRLSQKRLRKSAISIE